MGVAPYFFYNYGAYLFYVFHGYIMFFLFVVDINPNEFDYDVSVTILEYIPVLLFLVLFVALFVLFLMFKDHGFLEDFIGLI